MYESKIKDLEIERVRIAQRQLQFKRAEMIHRDVERCLEEEVALSGRYEFVFPTVDGPEGQIDQLRKERGSTPNINWRFLTVVYLLRQVKEKTTARDICAALGIPLRDSLMSTMRSRLETWSEVIIKIEEGRNIFWHLTEDALGRARSGELSRSSWVTTEEERAELESMILECMTMPEPM